MKRETIVIGILVMLAMAGISTAAEGDLGISFDTTWVSKYIWRGVDMTDDKAAIQPSVNFGRLVTAYLAHRSEQRRLAQALLEQASQVEQLVRDDRVVHAHAALVEHAHDRLAVAQPPPSRLAKPHLGGRQL